MDIPIQDYIEYTIIWRAAVRENLPNVMDLKNGNGDYVLPRKIRDSIKEIAAALNVSGL